MKSALELAMERADAAVGGENIKLSDEQKAAVVLVAYGVFADRRRVAIVGHMQRNAEAFF